MYYKHIPERVINVDHTTITWNIPVITDQKMPANQPDIFDKSHPVVLYQYSTLIIRQ